jgi:hypothetical protein
MFCGTRSCCCQPAATSLTGTRRPRFASGPTLWEPAAIPAESIKHGIRGSAIAACCCCCCCCGSGGPQLPQRLPQSMALLRVCVKEGLDEPVRCVYVAKHEHGDP